MNNRFGWHSGSLECRNAVINNDLTIVGDLTFGDASTDTLTVNGAATFNANVTFALGSTEAFTMTCTDISAPMVMTNTITTAAKTGARALFNVKTNVAAGSYVNALKGFMEFTGTSGRTTGLASAVCNELKLPNTTLASGQYYPTEIEVEAQASTVLAGTTGAGGGYIYAKINGTTTDWEDKAGFFWLDGLTAASGNMLSANSQTIRAFVTSSMTSKYLMLSDAEDVLSLGTFATPRTFVTDTPIVMISGNAAANLSSGVSRCAWFRAKISAAQTANSIIGIEAQCRISDATTLGAGQNAGIWAYWEQSGTVALNSGNLSSAASCTVESASSLTVDSGAILAGVVVDSTVNGSAVINGTFDGIYIKKAGSALDFVSGIEMTDCISSEVFKFADDGTVCNDGNSQAITNLTTAGYLKVKVGSAVRYIWLGSNAPTS